MLSVYTAANFFIDIATSREDDCISNLKLNKLLYYAQGCHLARTGEPLFEERIEAWKLGPVAPAIYRKYKGCGSGPISATDDEYNHEQVTGEELETLIDVMREFGQYTGNHLVTLTHKTGTPWSEVYGPHGAEITKPAMRQYFLDNPVPRFEPSVDSVTVLPKEWYDESEDGEWEKYL